MENKNTTIPPLTYREAYNEWIKGKQYKDRLKILYDKGIKSPHAENILENSFSEGWSYAVYNPGETF